MSTNHAQWRALEAALRTQTLTSPQAFHALGRLARAETPSRQQIYGQATLRQLGETLRRKFPTHFPTGDLSPRLQQAVRLADAFTVAVIRNIEASNPDGYQVTISHLSQLTSLPTPVERHEWCRRCQKHRWTKAELATALSKDRPKRSRGGRRLADPVAGLRSALAAIHAVERHFLHREQSSHRRPLKAATRQQLHDLHGACLEGLQRLEARCQSSTESPPKSASSRAKSSRKSRHKP